MTFYNCQSPRRHQPSSVTTTAAHDDTGTSQLLDVNQNQIQNGDVTGADVTGGEPVVAKVFSDYREPADVLPPADHAYVARAFSSYQTGLDNAEARQSAIVAAAYARTFSRESEHKYALPQDAVAAAAITRSDFTLERAHQNVSRTRSNAEYYNRGGGGGGGGGGNNMFVASKFSNYPGGYVAGAGGSAGPLLGSRIPGQRGVLMRSPSDQQRLSSYKSQSLDRAAAQYHNMPQRGRSRAEIIKAEKQKQAAKAKQQQRAKQKDKKSSKHDKKAAAAANTKASAKPQLQLYKNIQPDIIRPAARADTPKLARTQPHSEPPVALNADVLAPSRPSPPSSPEDDPFALYARPLKVKKDAAQLAAAHDKRPISIDIPTDNPAPFVIPDTPASPDPPAVPPYPVPDTPKNRKRNKSESASRDLSTTGA